MAIPYDVMREKRDKKVQGVLGGMAPLWLVNEEYRPREDSLLFNLVYDNPVYSWISQRFKYDAFNDVLYHMGERRLREEDTLDIQHQEPYIPGEVATSVPNRPANRPSPPLPKV
jgi:hypothetical protein